MEYLNNFAANMSKQENGYNSNTYQGDNSQNKFSNNMNNQS